MWIMAYLICFSVLAYQRATLAIWALSFGILLVFMTALAQHSIAGLIMIWLIYGLVFFFLLAGQWRRQWVTSRLLTFYRKVMPHMSRTEHEALAAGTIGWEGDLFCGAPDWDKLLTIPKATLTAEEQAFIDGPVEALCQQINDWNITHDRLDLPPEMWEFLKTNGFFSLIIPKEYQGKAFSAYAHSQILIKVYSLSTAVATTIAVPNSLGPAELLLHYGTPEQKNYYLPRLALGKEIPCFALTGPEAGSDAGAMTDTGIVCWGDYQGNNVLGIRLNWNKRYITLAPVATVIGLAFKLYDPDHLIGTETSLGITCALIPRDTPGITIGRRHFPCNVPFQNGPTQGKDVFIPLDYIIGGVQMAGHGWRMLMECLAAGRGISLPASATGGAKIMSYAGGAYARIRRQFNVSIGTFEGIEAVLAQIAGWTYMMDAVRTLTAAQIDAGEKPAIASAITKYHVTELGRKVSDNAMDIHGGKAICLGPKNYLGRFYQAIPIAITVEGANILTRNLIIFGQGAMRCHPYIFAELEAANQSDDKKALIEFDKALWGHVGYSISNLARSFVLGLSSGYMAYAPSGRFKRYFQQATRFSAALALMSDVSLLVLGGSLKRKESISARLGDIHSYLYLLSAVLKMEQDQGHAEDDAPLVRWASLYCLYQIQAAFKGLFDNYPKKWVKYVLKYVIFPWGMRFTLPSDRLSQKVARLLLEPSETRARLVEGAYTGKLMAQIEEALHKVILAEPIEKSVKAAIHKGLISQMGTAMDHAKMALDAGIITEEQYHLLCDADEARNQVIAVDDFSQEELVAS